MRTSSSRIDVAIAKSHDLVQES